MVEYLCIVGGDFVVECIVVVMEIEQCYIGFFVFGFDLMVIGVGVIYWCDIINVVCKGCQIFEYLLFFVYVDLLYGCGKLMVYKLNVDFYIGILIRGELYFCSMLCKCCNCDVVECYQVLDM